MYVHTRTLKHRMYWLDTINLVQVLSTNLSTRTMLLHGLNGHFLRERMFQQVYDTTKLFISRLQHLFLLIYTHTRTHHMLDKWFNKLDTSPPHESPSTHAYLFTHTATLGWNARSLSKSKIHLVLFSAVHHQFSYFLIIKSWNLRNRDSPDFRRLWNSETGTVPGKSGQLAGMHLLLKLPYETL